MLRTRLMLMMVGLVGASAAIGAAPPGARSVPPITTTDSFNELDRLMGLLAMRQHGRVEFVEQQFLHVLNHPIESSGDLTYDAPDRLEKHTLKPRAETLILSGGTLTVERAQRRRILDLHAYPQVLPFVESIRATLAGDRSALEKLFHCEFSGNVARWTLTLLPLDLKVKNSVTQVRIDGMRDELLKVEIRQPDGDRSLMTLRPAPP